MLFDPSGSNFNINLHKVVHGKSEVRNDEQDTSLLPTEREGSTGE